MNQKSLDKMKSKEIKKELNKDESNSIFEISIFLSKLLYDHNANKFTYKIEDVTDSKGKNIGSYKLTVKKL